MSELFERLIGCGVPLSRLAIGVRVLHPMVRDVTYTVRAGERAIEHRPYHYGIEQQAIYLESPIHALHSGVPELRRRLVGPDAMLDFPVLIELRDAGLTDYLGLRFRFSSGAPNAITFGTLAEGGFTDANIALLREVTEVMALVLEVRVQRLVAGTLLDTYLGHDAGQRVLSGQVRRGDSETIRAVIWLSDLRGFTAMSDALPMDRLLGVLNAFFERQVGPIQARGGEVLKFMGDGLLAVFRVTAEGPERACEAALQAATEAVAHLDAYNATGGDGAPLRLGLALHLGDVVFGNMGAPERMDFTVIGDAVNLASRVERLCKRLGRPILVSDTVAEALEGVVELEPMGAHRVDGVPRPVSVFAPGVPRAL